MCDWFLPLPYAFPQLGSSRHSLLLLTCGVQGAHNASGMPVYGLYTISGKTVSFCVDWASGIHNSFLIDTKVISSCVLNFIFIKKPSSFL
jgi:hypothetical protein